MSTSKLLRDFYLARRARERARAEYKMGRTEWGTHDPRTQALHDDFLRKSRQASTVLRAALREGARLVEQEGRAPC